MKRSKKYIAAAEKVKADHLYTPLEAVTLAKETSVTKYDSTIEVALVLGVDPKKADQAIRGTVNLPHGTGKTARVLVFANGERAEEARAAGADIVGGDELIDEVSKGRLDFDAVVATPDLMAKVGPRRSDRKDLRPAPLPTCCQSSHGSSRCQPHRGIPSQYQRPRVDEPRDQNQGDCKA